VLIMNLRPGGMTIGKQQGMEVLGVNLSPFVSFKDRYVVRPRVMLDACLTLSWPVKSLRPRSLQCLSGRIPRSVKVRTPFGSKDVRGVNGIRPRSQVRVLTLADWRSLGVRHRTDPRIGLELC